MIFRTSLRVPLLAGAVLAAGTAFAACSGGTSGVLNPLPAATPSAPPIPQSTFAPVTTVQSIPTAAPTPAGQTPAPNAPPPNIPIPMPSAAGIGGTVGLPLSSSTGSSQSVIPPNTQITEKLLAANQPPAGLPTLSFLRQTKDVAAHTVITYLGLYFSNPVTLASAPVMTFNLPAFELTPNTNYFLALYDPLRPQLGWQYGFEGPAAITGNTLTFGGAGIANPFNYSGFTFYWFALYGASATAATPTPAPVASTTPLPTPSAPASTPTPTVPTPSPTPTPTPVPTPTPSPTPVPQFAVAPSSVSLTAVGQTATFSASGVGPFTVGGNDATIATVSPASGTGTFTVTAVKAGTTGITVTDSLNRTATVSVTVTTTTIPIQ